MSADSTSHNVFGDIEKNNEAKMLDLYQGDIILDNETRAMIEEAQGNTNFKRNAVRRRTSLWMSRVIPYYVPYNMRHIKSKLNMAINEIHKHTCLRFVPYSGHRNYIKFYGSNGCSAKVGKKYHAPGEQSISIGPGCVHVGTILHELLHTLGFWHEQARADRDKYVRINYENITPGFKDQFAKYSWKTIDDLGLDYDYQSIMHYDRKAFTKNGKPTMQAIHDPNMEFGIKQGRLSTKDIIELNALYDCRSKRYGWTSWSDFTPCDENCMKSRERYCYHSGNIKMCGGNVNVYGIEKQRVDCIKCPEPIDGHWGKWGKWSSCSATCDQGKMKRSRVCNNPSPAHGGKACFGSGTERTLCSLRRCHLDFDDTDFERGLGMWSNVQGDNFDWTRRKGFTQTAYTGPMEDHTSGKGYYMYIESSAPRRPGDKARLVSPWLPYRTGGQCLKFAYSMYGESTGVLRVTLELKDRNVKQQIFYEKGDKGEGWKLGQGNIDVPQHVKYRLSFEATIGSAVGYSDIAIDDVYIDPGQCNCQDKYQICKRWASQGECTKNANWMKKHCKRSCNACHCKDIHQMCKGWASQGECTKNANWMKKHCKRSCNACPCHDDHIRCFKWANAGECTKNPTYMLKNCKRSCKKCL